MKLSFTLEETEFGPGFILSAEHNGKIVNAPFVLPKKDLPSITHKDLLRFFGQAVETINYQLNKV